MAMQKLKRKYVYPAVFYCDDDGIAIEFPDLPGCLSCADSMAEAKEKARSVLALYLYNMEQDGEDVPEPTGIEEIQAQEKETILLIEPVPVFEIGIEA